MSRINNLRLITKHLPVTYSITATHHISDSHTTAFAAVKCPDSSEAKQFYDVASAIDWVIEYFITKYPEDCKKAGIK